MMLFKTLSFTVQLIIFAAYYAAYYTAYYIRSTAYCIKLIPSLSISR
jgi:hypothetical protein